MTRLAFLSRLPISRAAMEVISIAAGLIAHVLRKPLGPERLTRSPAEWVILPRFHRQRQDGPFLAAMLRVVQQPAAQIILVPAGLNNYNSPARHQSGVSGRGVPILGFLADRLRFRFLPVFHRIINQ